MILKLNELKKVQEQYCNIERYDYKWAKEQTNIIFSGPEEERFEKYDKMLENIPKKIGIYNENLDDIIVLMQHLETKGNNPRLVVWFDN